MTSSFAGHQQLTQEWWDNRSKFDLFVSQTVIEEAAAGDREAARQRLAILEDLPLLALPGNPRVGPRPGSKGPLPAKAEIDALHIAIAVTNRVDYLLTWNCKHLANAALRSRTMAKAQAS